MAASESDDEETFVTIGTAVDVPDQDEPLKKPVSFQDAPVKDDKGRQRFHGAFTGGFSAGYFNTVGTQEGWTPATFISSRGDRSKPQSSQRPEDFMDEEDLGEYGIAPRKHVTSSTFASEERRKRRHDEAKLATSDTTLLGNSALLNLIIPERITIGVKLLRKMGWKEGQGVGPRITKRQKKSLGTKKVYGCELPPDDSDEDEGFDDEAILKDITFAPKDSAHILLNVKDNTKGLGYRGLDPNKALPSSHISLFGRPVPSKTGRKGIRGQAFGVGALEDDDEDIYAVDDMSNYDMTMTAENENETFGWTGSKFKGETSTPVGYVGKLLEGFKLSSEKLIQKKDFPPPKLPSNFRPIHVFQKHEETVLTMSAKDGMDYRQFMKPRDEDEDQSVKPTETTLPSSQSGLKKSVSDSVSRSLALGEQPFVGSIFDLIPEHDKKKMDRIKAGVSVEPQVEGSSLAQDGNGNLKGQGNFEMTKTENTSKEESHMCDTSTSSKPLYQGSALGFKPFATDSAKQERYDKYLALVKQGHKDPYNLIAVPGQTEWEMEREKEEFAHAARLFKPLASMMAMRFTSAGTEDKATESSKQDTQTELSEPAKAAAMKMYGKLTREVMEWHPDKLLCKRFNVPDPYPQSNMVGLASLRRDKYSVFNFLTFANPTEADKNQSKMEDKNYKDNRKDSEANTTNRTLKPLPASAGTKGLKSIFTHLVDPAKGKGQSTETKKSGLSFSIKSKATEKPKELAPVFSDAKKIEDDSSEKKNLPRVASVFESDEEGGGTSLRHKNSGENEKVGMDLFRAIFKNTDSEDSSSDDDVKDAPNEETAHNVISSENADTVIGDNRMEEETEISTKIVSTSVDDSEVSTSVPSEAKILPGSGECIPSINQRLSPDVDSDSSEAYGPALPPPSNVNTENALNKVPINEPYIDLTKDSGRKHKHKHKDRHKAKKEKKNKSKKSRHKKKQKKREKKGRKHKEQEKSDTDSSDTTDKDTDSDVEIPSDRDLLDKMKQLQPGRRIRAADFL